MRIFVAISLILLGGAVLLYGGGGALRELFSLYGSALNNPLDGPPGGEQGLSDRMLHGVKVGAIGLLPLIVGVALLKGSFARRGRRGLRD
ncbi:MAG: hypothetical protein ACOYN0_06120 [Phycisphaerales bacterium]